MVSGSLVGLLFVDIQSIPFLPELRISLSVYFKQDDGTWLIKIESRNVTLDIDGVNLTQGFPYTYMSQIHREIAPKDITVQTVKD